jgi:PD-(D/E)XK endonuclease
MELSTDQKGAIAEACISAAAIKLGIGVFRPLSDGERYDLIFDLRPKLARVQCKWAPLQGDVVSVRCYSCRRTRSGLLQRGYTADDIDAIAAYCAELDRCFYVSADWLNGKRALLLRVRRSRNNQCRRINWADEFALERLRFGLPGAVAQLGERPAGSREVRGSSPLGSTFSA